MKKLNILAAGELLWDMLPEGRRCGGATANITYHAIMQGINAKLCSAVGCDPDGTALTDFLDEKGIATDFIARVHQVTGHVDVQLKNGIPDYIIQQPSAWDEIPLTDSVCAFAENAQAFCFGSLAQRDELSRKTILELAKKVPETAWKVFDINLRQNFYSETVIRDSLNAANVLKVSTGELPVLRDMFCLPSGIGASARALLDLFQLRAVIYTDGENGSTYFDSTCTLEQTCISGGKVVDTVGCGDSYLASFIAAMLQGAALPKALRHAARVSGLVAARAGAVPDDPEFRELVKKSLAEAL